jgi:ABC-type antimicrobial peptide transport system permease subunit
MTFATLVLRNLRRNRLRTALTMASVTLSVFLVTPWNLFEGILLSLFVGVIAGVIPSWGAARKPVAQALREVF